MKIQDFTRFRVENEHLGSTFIDIEKIGDHSREGFMAVAYCMGTMNKWGSRKVEVRSKDRQIALITYEYSDAELAEYWQDAEVLFVWSQDLPQAIVTTESAQAVKDLNHPQGG